MSFNKSNRRRIIFGLHFTSKRRRVQLDTGEAVDYVNENTSKLATGEMLRRIKGEA